MQTRIAVQVVFFLAATVITACGSTVRPVAGTDASASAIADSEGLSVVEEAGQVPSRATGQVGANPGVQGASTGSRPASAGGSSSPIVATPAGTAATSSSSVATQPGTSPAGDASGQAQTPADGGTSTAPASAQSATGRGFDETTINIGIGKTDDEEYVAAAGSLGINLGETTIDSEAALQAVVDDVNATGGIAGRQVNLVEVQHNVGELLFSPATAAQTACATWTEDRPVFAVVLPAVEFVDDLLACLHDHDTPLVYQGGSEGDGRSFQEHYDHFPNYYNIGAIEAGRYSNIAARRLVERGFFENWDTVAGAPASGPTAAPTKLALIVKDSERGDRTLESLTAELQRNGVEVASVFRISGRVENAAPESQSAMLRFRSEGITHIYGSGVFHHTSGEQQGYRPRYWFWQEVLNIVALTSPAEQLRGSMAQSAIPAAATNESTYPGPPSPATHHCLAVMEAAGINPSTNNDHLLAQTLCDGFYPLRQALAAGGNVLSNDGLRAGFAALGQEPVSATTWTSSFTTTEHASAIALRDVSFVEECTCYAYDSDVNHYAE